MTKHLTYHGRVDENGALKLPGTKIRADVARLFTGKEIEVIIRKKKTRRSDQQNRFYWKVVVPLVVMGIKDLGDEVTTEQAHEFLKMRFLKVQKIDEVNGEVVYEYARSTAELTTVEFADYLEKCGQFAAEYLGVIIPEPEVIG